jgi:hypothetical protein
MRQVLALEVEDDYLRPSRYDFHRDYSSLRDDARRISSGLRKTTEQHGKQVHNSQG